MLTPASEPEASQSALCSRTRRSKAKAQPKSVAKKPASKTKARPKSVAGSKAKARPKTKGASKPEKKAQKK